ncbi:MAG: UDP-N-acetylmuramate--L-alanine ligase [Treponematales bacterium]
MSVDIPFPAVKKAYLIGIKGTGMAALAELLRRRGVEVSGSDGGEVFYTDGILRELGIPFHESFDAGHIKDDVDLVVYSAAYSFETNPEMAEARRRGLRLCKYTDALGAFSALFDSSGVAGVHGKTTTTALAGTLAQAAGLPAQTLAGSAVASFGGRSTMALGDKYFIAETCEYQRNFLSFRPRRVVLTSVESDHQDFYPTYESIRDAFLDYCLLLPDGGELIYCADDPGASEVAAAAAAKKSLTLTPYGFSTAGDFGVTDYRVENARALFTLKGFDREFSLRVPGRHIAVDAAAALALVSSLVKKEFDGWTNEKLDAAVSALAGFSGSKRRSEILGGAGGILFMDDYGHHPAAVRATLAGLKEFYPERRLVVSFMSHTYTRTAALLDDFAACFDAADIIMLHKIYPSARETYSGGVNGRTLYERTLAHLAALPGWAAAGRLHYIEEPLAAVEPLRGILKRDDLFLTMGAGDNWKLGQALLARYRAEGV